MAREPGQYKPRGKVRVRCLGPGEEHTFLSADPKRNRLCPYCTRELNRRFAGDQYRESIPDPRIQ